MFRIGELVQHKTTGKLGKIVGHGCLKRDRTYFMTLKVKPLKGNYFKPPIEDTMNEWRCVRPNCPQLLEPNSRRHKLTA